MDLVPALAEAGVEYGWGVGDHRQVDGRPDRARPPTQGRLGVPLHPTQDRLLALMAQEVWEVGALWHQSRSLGERTALLVGRLLARLLLVTAPVGEPLFQVELASKQRETSKWHHVIRYKSSGISKKALGLGIGAGFLGGAALGVAGAMATASVYQRLGSWWVQFCSC